MWKPIILDVECIVCNKTLHKLNHDPREVTRNMGKIANNNSRRSRTPNWSMNEKQYLLELIRHRKDVVVSMNNNGPNHSVEKDVAWNQILRELALKFGNKFIGSSTKKVKTQWQNMKRIAREEISVNGPSVQKYTKQSIEVCHILDLIQDGLVRTDIETPKETPPIAPSVEIKTERIEEDANQLSVSGTMEPMETTFVQENLQNEPHENTSLQSSSPSSDQNGSDVYEDQALEEAVISEQPKIMTKEASIMTDTSFISEDTERNDHYNGFQKIFQEFMRYTSTEKQLKMDTLKEERQVVRAMRETAELNKIIAEQKLKHVLWMKRQEMTMYSGEPGSGAGKGGGGGGSIREAGGAFGKMEVAREEEYFYKKQREQLLNIKEHLDKEIQFHQDAIKRHEDAIKRHKDQMSDMAKK